MNVLFICNGNICRSPIAEALLRKKFKAKNLDGEVSSAGFESYNINEPPDPLAMELSDKFDFELDHKARLFLKDDFNKFDKIYVMDTGSYRNVKYLAGNENDLKKIDYLMNVVEPGKNKTIPNPFLSGKMEMIAIYNLLDKATDKIVDLALNN
jgi:protein-tyrosine phosphatase